MKQMDQCEEDVEEGHRELSKTTSAIIVAPGGLINDLVDFVFRKKLEFGRDSATGISLWFVRVHKLIWYRVN